MASTEQKVSDHDGPVSGSGVQQASRKPPGRYEEVRRKMSNTESIMRRKASPETSQTSFGGRGRPLQVVVANEPYQFSLDTAALKKIFQDPRVVDSKVAILSVAGSCRHGKSFILNFFLKYLRAQGVLLWLNDEENVLEDGFSWVTGVEPHTSGIVMWSEPFMVRDSRGDAVALLLMDTQGAFNCESTLKESIQIFSLSVMISSIQIYNLSSNIHETDLQHLQLFTEYSKLAMAEGVDRAFQHLVFLVRDWQYPYQYPYGAAGGQALIEHRLQTYDSQHPELRDLRDELRKCFSKISCFLLPHPGFKASVSENFKGEIKDLEEAFKTNIFHLVPFLIGKDNLVVKEFNKSPLTGKEIMEYFLTYFNIFRADDLPHPKSVLQMTSEANNLAATIVAQDHYIKTMKRKFGEHRPYAEPKSIQSEHEAAKQESLRIFDLTPKTGSRDLSDTYARKLDAHLDEWFVEFAKANDLKVTGQLGVTPGILFVTLVALYTVSGMLTLLSLDFLCFVPDVASYCVVGLLVTWLLVKYTGEHHDVSDVVDGIAVAIWQTIYLPIWIKIDHNAGKASSSATPKLASPSPTPD